MTETHGIRDVLDPELLHDRSTCTCTRCTGFLPGNTLRAGLAREEMVVHGAHSRPLVLAPHAEKIAELIRPLMPIPHPSFEGTLQSYCILLARIQRAHDGLEKAERLEEEDDAREEEWNRTHEDGEVFERVRPRFDTMALGENLRRWQASALKHASELGLTPMSAAKILKDAELGKLAAHMQLTREEAQKVPTQSLEKLRAALTEALDENVA